jgi:signal peptidase I
MQKQIEYIKKVVKPVSAGNHWAQSLARDIGWVIVTVGSIALVLFLICGTWPAVVTIESKSMDPNMKMGDLVVVVQKDRYGAFQTWNQDLTGNGKKFGDYGDVIIYKPNGMTTVHPIIHRAIVFATGTPLSGIRGKNLSTNYTAPHPGYITWGDNNPYPDQFSSINNIGPIEPVQDEWIIGKALFSVPLAGYLPLHIIEIAIILFILMVFHELYLRSKAEGKSSSKRKK